MGKKKPKQNSETFSSKGFGCPNQNSADHFARWSQTHHVLGVASIVVQKLTTRCNHAFTMVLRIEALDWFWANQRALATFWGVHSALPYKGRPSQRWQKETGVAGTGHRNTPEYFLLPLFLLLFHLHHWDYFSLAASREEHGHQVSFLFIHVFIYLRLLKALFWGYRPLVCLSPEGGAGRECVSPSDPPHM